MGEGECRGGGPPGQQWTGGSAVQTTDWLERRVPDRRSQWIRVEAAEAEAAALAVAEAATAAAAAAVPEAAALPAAAVPAAAVPDPAEEEPTTGGMVMDTPAGIKKAEVGLGEVPT